ncbi:synaptic vesicular amine transporter isoform X1 [Strongylocentrotus purpuratus]|uniref:Major facilitator superfamily (MFS) profile domain-containing protein n=1 Tax=Strongylocentrotus purpuratus TaxID=7668 RepID=A0A7M7SZA1_STRPU|nr:synaptic vesicular amine transporter isoform X1 [Strongylocentrotus purpuratus]
MSVSLYIEKVKTGFGSRWQSFSLTECIRDLRASRKLVLFIVFVALLLDNMLTTVIVPIIPDYIFHQENPGLERHPNHSIPINCSLITTPVPREISGANTTSAPVVCLNSSMYAANTTAASEEKQYNEILRHESVRIGLLFASKSIVQLITNPLIGPLTNRIGYSLPMFTGFLIMFASTLVFAFGESFALLLVARMIQGVGSSCSSVAGMGMLAQRFPNDAERGAAMGFALAGLALGVLIGPPFGGVMYEFVGKTSPFLILAILALFDGLLQLLLLNPVWTKEDNMEGTPILKLLKDPYVLIAAGCITFGNMGIALLEPSLPLYMLDKMEAEKWQLGAIFLPASVSYLISTNIFGVLGHRIGRWLVSMIGMIIGGIAMMLIPLSQNVPHLIGPNFFVGFGVGMVDASMMPIMGHLVDIRHVSVYGSVYAIADVAFCLGFAVGPSVSGSIVESIGFPWLVRIVAIIDFMYAPLLLFLRDPPGKEENEGILLQEQLPVSYTADQQRDYQTMDGRYGRRDSSGVESVD